MSTSEDQMYAVKDFTLAARMVDGISYTAWFFEPVYDLDQIEAADRVSLTGRVWLRRPWSHGLCSGFVQPNLDHGKFERST